MKTLFFLTAITITLSYNLNAQSWSITGNANIASGTNYIGTKDPNDFVFRTNAIERGRIVANGRWHFGTSANYAQIDNSGTLSFSGKGAYKVNGNKYVFQYNGNNNYGLFYNSAKPQYEFRNGNAIPVFTINADNGYSVFGGSITPDTSGQINIGTPAKAWKNIYTTGDYYIYGVRFISNKGEGNSFVGYQAGYYNSARYVTAIGYNSLLSNEGDQNTAVGTEALYSNLSGSENTSTGYDALYSNTEGYDNTAVGCLSLYSNTKGGTNTAIGLSALINNSSGGGNLATGTQALSNNTTGSDNVAAGTYAGQSEVDGYGDVFVGYLANCGTGGHLTNGMALGYLSSVTSSNHVVIGNSSVTSIGGYVNWSNISDGRVKKDIKQNVPGLLFINKLQPVTYNLDLNAADKIIDKPVVKDKEGKVIKLSSDDLAARKAKEQIVYTGFIAQDVEKSAKELNYDFSGVDAAKNEHDLYGLRYSDFVVPLVKAVQELSAQNDSLKNENENLEARVSRLEAMMQSTVNGQQSTVNSLLSSASLSQNNPNPFNNTTTINYNLPHQYSSAKIIVTDKNGNALKQINLSGNKGSVNVDAATLSAGAYQYSLYVDGKLIASKQMIISN